MWREQKSAYIAHENDPEMNTHVLLATDRLFTSLNAKVFDYNEIHPRIGESKHKKYLKDLYKFMAERDDTLMFLSQ